MSLRMIELTVPIGTAEELAGVSEGLQIMESWHESLDEDLMLLRILARSESTEAIIKKLDSSFRSRPGYRLVIFEVQATVPPPQTQEPPTPAEKASQEAEKKEDPLHIACVELVQRLSGNMAANRIFIATIVLSTTVAAIGLIRNNVAAIIGAMVIAPLLTPNMTLALATTLGDSKLAWKSLRINMIGFSLALLLAVLIGAFATLDLTQNELSSRATVGLSDVTLALAAGAAGALALTTGLSEAIVGVMVAVALLPPLVATGLLLGSGHWKLAMASLLLTAVNIICVNLAGVATFLWQGIRPHHWWEADNARRMVRVAVAIWLVLLASLVALILLAHQK